MKLTVAGPLLVLALFPSCSAPREAAPPEALAVVAQVPAAQEHAPRPGRIDVEHYALDLTLIPEERRIEGTCTVRLFGAMDGLRVVALDLEGLTVESVVDSRQRSLSFTQIDGQLHVELAEPLPHGEPAQLAIRYGGSPRKGLWFVGGSQAPTHAFTQGECEDARWWFPCWDVPADRATSELRVTVPESWTTLAAGELLDSQSVDGRRTDTWRMTAPHPTYLTTLVAGDLATLEQTWDGLPVLFLSPPGFAHRLLPCLDATGDALAFLSRVTGRRYPYSKYAIACVENFPFGGMENVSATTITVTALRDEMALLDGDAEGLVVHEAAHQWFGNLLTCADWSHIWLNEGLATYLTLMWFEETRGADEFRLRVGEAIEGYLDGDDAERRALVHGVYKDPIDLFFGGHVYEGGATRMHLLRFLLGEEAFLRGLRRYVGDNANRAVVTDDLRRAFEAASGIDLTRFFEQWVESPGHPELEVRWRWDAARQRVLLTVLQTHPVEPGVPQAFEFPVDVEVRDAQGALVQRILVSRRRELFELPARSEPEWVRFDKYRWLPARIVEHKSPQEWALISNHDDDVHGRLAALRGLVRAWQGEQDETLRAGIVHTLAGRLEGDAMTAVRADAARALGVVRTPQARQWLVLAAQSERAPAVRMAALEALEGFGPDPELARLGRQLVEERTSFRAAGAAAGLVAAADPTAAAAWFETALEGAVGEGAGLHGELRAALLERLGGVRDPRALEPLLRHALDSTQPQPVRVAAARGLPPHALADPRAREALVTLLQTPLADLRRTAVAGLATLADEAALAALAAHYLDCVSPREKRVMERALAGHRPQQP